MTFLLALFLQAPTPVLLIDLPDAQVEFEYRGTPSFKVSNEDLTLECHPIVRSRRFTRNYWEGLSTLNTDDETWPVLMPSNAIGFCNISVLDDMLVVTRTNVLHEPPQEIRSPITPEQQEQLTQAFTVDWRVRR